jgi:hypothetical protein
MQAGRGLKGYPTVMPQIRGGCAACSFDAGN